MEDGSEVFTLVLKPKRLGISNEELGLSLTNDITEIEAWDKDNQQLNVVLTQKQNFISNLPIATNEGWSFSPNPTSGEVIVKMISRENKSVLFELIDAQGKNLFTHNFELNKGANVLNLNLKEKNNLPSGLYFIKANGITKRLIVKNNY